MTLQSVNGASVLKWVPSVSDVGYQMITVRVQDGRGGSAIQSFGVRVDAASINHPPRFTSNPGIYSITPPNSYYRPYGQAVYVGSTYSYQATALDPDADPLTFSVLAGPTGAGSATLTISNAPATLGLVTWTPTVAQLGLNSVQLQVSDGRGGFATQSYRLNVLPDPNDHPPVIVSTPVTSVPAGQTYTYNTRAVDSDNDALTWSLTTNPSGMTINPQTGVITWSTTGVNPGTFPVTVRVDDGRGLFDTQPYNVSVTTLNELRGRKYAESSPLIDPTAPLARQLNAISLAQVSVTVDRPQGIDYYEPANSLVVAQNDNSGTQPNFVLVANDPNGSGNGATKVTAFSNVTNLINNDEVQLAVVKANNIGGFTAGDVFATDGQPGRLLKITNGGSTVVDPWVTFPSAPDGNSAGLPRTGLTFDTTGNFQGDLIVATNSGLIWKINSQGVPTFVADLHVSGIEGVITVANDPIHFGPLAGKIVVTNKSVPGAPELYTIDAAGNVISYNLGIGGMETIDQIPANSNFFAVNENTNVFVAPAANFASCVGDFILVKENPVSGTSGFYHLYWDGNQLVTQPIALSAPAPQVGTWEDVAFAPAPLGTVPDTRPGVPNWTIYLDTNHNGQLDAGEPSTQTDQSGNYVFTNVPAGTYTVAEVNQAGWTQEAPASSTYQVTVTTGQVIRGLDFGNLQAPAPDRNPVIQSNPILSARVGARYQYIATATDPDSDPLTFDLPVKPLGMAIDPTTGVIAWTPTSDQIGGQAVLLRVRDGRGGIALQSFQVAVNNSNSPPAFTTRPVTSVHTSQFYRYSSHAVDPNNDTLTYQITSGIQSGMTLDANTGVLTWVAPASSGSYPITLSASDGLGGVATQSFTIAVAQDNGPGTITITSIPRAAVQFGLIYRYQIQASDSNSDTLSYALVSSPSGMTINPSTGMVTWDTSQAGVQLGTYSVTVKAYDNRGGFATQAFSVIVASRQSNQPPQLTSAPRTIATVGQLYSYDPQASDPDGDSLTWSLDAAPAGMSIDPTTGSVRWTPTFDQQRNSNVTIRVADSYGGWATQSFAVSTYATNLPPNITSNPPINAGVGAAYQYAIQATDPENDPLTYYLTQFPTGMTIDPASGMLQWANPGPAGASPTVAIAVTDGQGNVATQSYTLIISSAPPDVPPVITSTSPPTAAAAGNAYQYQVVASDKDGDALSYTLLNYPSGMTISTTGLVQWTPLSTDTGTYLVKLAVTDSANQSAFQNYTLTVTNDQPPQILAAPSKTITAGRIYSFMPSVFDPDGDPLSYSLISAPQGMTVDSTRGAVTWQTGIPNIGTFNYQIKAVDPAGLSATQSFQVQVVADTQAPTVVLTASPTTNLYPGQVESVEVIATDDVGVTTENLTVLTPAGTTVPLAIDVHGGASFTLSSLGTYTFNASASDAAGHTTTATSVSVTVTAPSVSLSGQPGGAIITSLVVITGNATGTLTSWSLAYGPLGGSATTQIASGTSSPANGQYGLFDPTLLADGAYTVQLTATNSSGVTTVVSQIVNAAGKLKLGNVAMSSTDLTVPSAGLPLTLTRVYDTLDASRVSQMPDGYGYNLGYGWRFAEGDFNLKVGLPNTTYSRQGVFPGYQDGTHVTLTRPGMSPEGFTFTPVPVSIGGSIDHYIPQFVPDSGVYDSLSVPQVPLVKLSGVYVTLTDAGLDPYNPADAVFSGGGNFSLSAYDGRTWALNAGDGLVSTETDRNGNTLTFSSTGISSSSGRSITFQYDTAGRISSVTDPLNNKTIYTYDANNNLQTSKDRNGNATQYAYNTSQIHKIDHIVDPFNRTALQVNYGTDGRVLGQTDAQGNTTSNAFNVSATTLSGTVTAPGNTTSTSVGFDTVGNVTSATDPLGNSVSNTFSGQNLKTSTQTVGSQTLTRKFDYNAQGQAVDQTDPAGNTSYVAYNNFGEPTSVSDAVGDSTTFVYDANGNFLSSTSPTGIVSSSTYNTRGQVLTTTTPSGTSRLVYNTNGDLAQMTDARGVVQTFTYDADGNQTASQWTWTNPSNSSDTRVVSTQNTYDAEGHVTKTVSPTGTTQTFYDAAGRVYKTIDNLGEVSTTLYDTAGRVIQTTDPESRISDTVYDAQGRVLYTDDPHRSGDAANGAKTIYDADGNVVGTQRLANVVITITNPTTNPVSSFTSAGAVISSTSAVYDAAGRVSQSTDETGHTVSYVYDLAGNQTEVDDTVNGASRSSKTVYDTAGRVLQQIDALGNVTTFIRDDEGRVIAATYPDGSTTQTKYDANGRKIAEIDQNNLETDDQYDSLGRLVSVQLPAPSSTSVRPTYTYGYDAYGDMTSVTDPLGHVTSDQYDQLGRQVSHTLPMGQSETWAYNSLGQMTQHIDFNGQKTTYAYDAFGRVQTKNLYQTANATSATSVSTYTYDVYDTNHDGGRAGSVTTTTDGTTTSNYDLNGNLVKVTSPQGVIQYGYDALNRKTSLTTSNTHQTYAYDALGRLASTTVDKLDGVSIAAPLVTSYAYDLNNNLTATTQANGVVESRVYDSLNRLVQIKDALGSTTLTSFHYGLDPAGHRLDLFEASGRSETYTYDNLYRLTAETIKDPTLGTRNLTWTYDLAGNRLIGTDSGAPAGQVSLTYTYDANDRLTNVTGSSGYSVSYTYDANGNTLSTTGSIAATYTWDLENRLTAATTPGHTLSYIYDDSGTRVGETDNGAQTKFLIDKTGAYDQVLEEYQGAVLAGTYLRGLDLMFEDRAGTRSFYIKDGLGSTRALTNASGAVTDTIAYDAFGNQVAHTGTTVNPFLYTGEQFDASLNKLYLRARYLDTGAGQFMSRDSFEGNTFDPITLNHYIYAGADPVDNGDPSGHKVVPGEEALVGTFVNNYLSRQFEAPGGQRLNNRWGNRWISTIARALGYNAPLNSKRPDAAEYNEPNNTGDVYEFKHVPGDNIADPSAVASGLLTAQADLPGYINLLGTATPGIVWSGGTTWMNGVKDWGPINLLIPRTTSLTDSNDHLWTIADYGILDGALVWASASPGSKPTNLVERLNPILDLALISTAAAELIKDYAYASRVAANLEVFARINVTAIASADVETGVTIATADSTLSGGGL